MIGTKHFLLLAGLVTVLFAGSCSKKDKDTAKVIFSKDWTFNKTNNTADSVDREGGEITFYAANGNFLVFAFGDDLPSKDGAYKIINVSDAIPGGVTIALFNDSGLVMGGSNTEGKTLQVTVSGGKLQFSCKDITLWTTDRRTGTFSTEQFSVNITE